MSAHGLRRAWMPALLVGAAGAIAAEVAVAILLYAGPGLVRSLTTVLAVEGAALAAGLQTAPATTASSLESLRRRWLLCFGAFMAAALYGTAWSLFEGLGAGRLGQGIGLALLAGLPMFGCGAVLGSMGSMSAADPRERRRGPSAAAAMGAALGFVATGLLLPRAPMPASLLVGCLVLLSGAGQLHRAVLASANPHVSAGSGPQEEPSEPAESSVPVLPVGSDGSAEVAGVGSPQGDAPGQ